MKNRIAIYFFYDKDGVVDNYVYTFLDGLKKVTSKIVVVVNGSIQTSARTRIKSIADELICRPNEGYDSWAYREAIEYIGWNSLLEFDELIMANFTMFGPIYPFEEMFERMEASEADFWGIQRSYEKPNMKYCQGKKTVHGYMPEFPLSNFWVIREELLHSYEFKSYWDNLHPVYDYADACIYHEPVFAKAMTDYGFRMDSYVSRLEENYCNNPTIDNVFYQVKEERVPIIRRRAFFNDIVPMFDEGYNASLKNAITYIENNGLYDTDLIYSNILRTANLRDIVHRLNCNYLVKKNVKSDDCDFSKMAIAFILNSQDEYEKLENRIRDKGINVVCFVRDLQKFEETENIIQISEETSSLKCIVEYFENTAFDYVCIVPGCSENVSNKMRDVIHRERNTYGLFDDLGVVKQIKDLFDKHKCVGLVTYSPFVQSSYFGNVGSVSDVKGIIGALDEMQVGVASNFEGACIGLNNEAFWYRKGLVEDYIKGYTGTNDAVLEDCFLYLMQNQGCIPAFITEYDQAANDINYLYALVEELNLTARRKFGRTMHFRKLLSEIGNSKEKVISKEVIREVEKPTEKKVFVEVEPNPQEYLDKVSTSLLVKKLLKRLIPQRFWEWIRYRRYVHSEKKYIATNAQMKYEEMTGK